MKVVIKSEAGDWKGIVVSKVPKYKREQRIRCKAFSVEVKASDPSLCLSHDL
jgi:hypothetical protein